MERLCRASAAEKVRPILVGPSLRVYLGILAFAGLLVERHSAERMVVYGFLLWMFSY